MAKAERVDEIVIETFRRIHLDGAEWTLRDDVLRRAEELAVTEGGLGETKLYRIGSAMLRTLNRQPGTFLERRRYVQLDFIDLGIAIDSLRSRGILEDRRSPQEPLPGRHRPLQYSLTYLHPIYGSQVQPEEEQ